MPLNREQLRKRYKPKTVEVSIGDDTILLQEMNAMDRLHVFDAFNKVKKGDQEGQLKCCLDLVAVVAVDEQGNRLFDTAEDVALLKESEINDVVAAALNLNSDPADAAKKSKPSRKSASPSASA